MFQTACTINEAALVIDTLIERLFLTHDLVELDRGNP